MSRNIYVKESQIEGKGVFAKKNFKKGETVFILKGKIHRLKPNQIERVDEHPNWVGIDKATWIDPKGNFQYINHSCNPSMGIKGRVSFVALRNIKKGDELTFDYSITEENLDWKMKNLEKVTNKKYRKVISSIQSIPLSVYKSYLPYIPKYFQKVYNTHNKLKPKNG